MNKETLENYTVTVFHLWNEGEITFFQDAIKLVNDLRRYSKTLERISLANCNRNLTKKEEKQWESTVEKVMKISELIKIPVEIGKDPRGYAIKFILPSGVSNSFSGYGWGI
jgi:hypothetical protein